MIIAVGTDHAGYALKSVVMEAVRRAGHEVLDCGADHCDAGDDYPKFAERVGRSVVGHHANRGIVICGSGVGASVAANKIPGIRASLCHDTFSARQGVEDDDMNVLCLGARIIGPSLCEDVLKAFLGASFSGAERHRRRVSMVEALERAATQPRQAT